MQLPFFIWEFFSIKGELKVFYSVLIYNFLVIEKNNLQSLQLIKAKLKS